MTTTHDAHLLNCGCLVMLPDPQALGTANGREAVVHRHPQCGTHALQATTATYEDGDTE